MVDDNQATHEAVAALKIQIKQLQRQNEALHASMESIQQQQHDKDEGHQDEIGDLDPQPLSAEIWNAPVPENFNSPPLSSFDGKSDPAQHITAFNTQMTIVGTPESLKCNLLSETLMKAALRCSI
ncbi:hypothetical protein MTR_1g068935 [Medicago truncatula]|uniref:Uncharacterized protein n=1 Tax=Medicago truncatula TaxID=3880 RepID=A0A072VLW6_MEDTR|nr:hypothetical protein MTR_1g068935 [Medicago truncatula]